MVDCRILLNTEEKSNLNPERMGEIEQMINTTKGLTEVKLFREVHEEFLKVLKWDEQIHKLGGEIPVDLSQMKKLIENAKEEVGVNF